MNTAFLLMAQYDARAIIPVETVVADYFPHLGVSKFLRKVGTGEIRLPLTRIEGTSQKTAKGIHLSVSHSRAGCRSVQPLSGGTHGLRTALRQNVIQIRGSIADVPQGHHLATSDRSQRETAALVLAGEGRRDGQHSHARLQYADSERRRPASLRSAWVEPSAAITAAAMSLANQAASCATSAARAARHWRAMRCAPTAQRAASSVRRSACAAAAVRRRDSASAMRAMLISGAVLMDIILQQNNHSVNDYFAAFYFETPITTGGTA